MLEYSDAKRKELETRALLGPRIGRAKPMPFQPTAPPSTGGTRRRGRTGKNHPVNDSGT